MPTYRNKSQRLYIRVSQGSLEFVVYHPYGGLPPVYESYEANPTTSLNVNLKEALRTTPLAQENYNSVEVMLNVPYTLVPIERFDEDEVEKIYRFNFHDSEHDRVFYDVAGGMGVVLVYGLSDAFCRVVDDNYATVHFTATTTAVANRFAEAARMLKNQQLFAYRHEGVTDLFAFRAGRLQLANRFTTHDREDAVYFIMLAQKTLNFSAEGDEVRVIDTETEGEGLAERLRDFVVNVKEIEPQKEFNRHPLTMTKGLPYDLAVYLMQPY